MSERTPKAPVDVLAGVVEQQLAPAIEQVTRMVETLARTVVAAGCMHQSQFVLAPGRDSR